MQLASFLPHYQLVCISFDISSFSLISYTPRRLVLHKTTAHFTQNDGSFYTKQRLVLHKTTARFTQNDGSFCTKQRLVLPKTTAHFTQNNGSFYTKQRLVCCIIFERHNTATVEKNNCEKLYNPPSHAYAYAHITGVLSFLLSQVSHPSS